MTHPNVEGWNFANEHLDVIIESFEGRDNLEDEDEDEGHNKPKKKTEAVRVEAGKGSNQDKKVGLLPWWLGV